MFSSFGSLSHHQPVLQLPHLEFHSTQGYKKVQELVVKLKMDIVLYNCRAGGNGTAGTAMAVPVFEAEKMASLGF